MKQTNIKMIRSTLTKLFRKTMNYSGMMLIFKNGLALRLGEDKSYFLILIGILGILFVYRIIIFMWTKFGAKNKKGEVSDE